MQNVAMYLRKSRADIESEKRGEGETLAKHYQILSQVAHNQSLNITKVRREIASGENLFNRYQMMKLLKEIEKNDYDAILVMDLDRLGRGTMQEQGLILETLQKTNTHIITPRKTYNLNDEFDEEYSAFEAFMARKELKMITRRLQSGIRRAVEDGNYLGSKPPYGYLIHKENMNRTLIPHPEQMQVVKKIFEWYTHPLEHYRLGTTKIAHELNRLEIRNYHNKKWKAASVLAILKNEIYTGHIVWGKVQRRKANQILQTYRVKKRPLNEQMKVVGKHPPLISKDLFQAAQQILRTRAHSIPSTSIVNPLAGLIRCHLCRSIMMRQPGYRGARSQLKCITDDCSCKSVILEIIEQRILTFLRARLHFLSTEMSIEEEQLKRENKHSSFNTTLQRRLQMAQQQKQRLYDHIEQKKEPARRLQKQLDLCNKQIQTLQAQLHVTRPPQQELTNRTNLNPINLYEKLPDPSKKNEMLKYMIKVCFYEKRPIQKADDFQLYIYPKL
ncbi:recombinase family protein [Hazenella sp. IB182353]|uniref:recombinase family protein n=1 Tax=Polycladospora coralii TaxID=2771432 RepID=UPI00174643B0|nr:recombinase family protein [Polycladospora coralii]MBS7529033.1 recombinase family protein [Polycladospora coralii]